MNELNITTILLSGLFMVIVVIVMLEITEFSDRKACDMFKGCQYDKCMSENSYLHINTRIEYENKYAGCQTFNVEKDCIYINETYVKCEKLSQVKSDTDSNSAE